MAVVRETIVSISPRNAVSLWALGFAGAGSVLAIAPKRFARDTAWGASPWQREIAIWNIGTLVGIARLRLDSDDPDRALAEGFSVLSALFAVNHAATIVRAPRKSGHWVAFVANVVGLTAGLVALRPQR